MSGATLAQVLQQFRPKVRVRVEWSRYLIKTVETAEELTAALRLRHEVFYRELLHREANTDAVDVDDFDGTCDHLVIIDRKQDNALIGTYRFNSSAFTDRFYTATEFAMGELLEMPGIKLEMGRACIRADMRTGFTFIALWKGLAAYIKEHPCRYLFGCSSVKETEPATVAAICDYLRRHGHYRDDVSIEPHLDFAMPGLDEAIDDLRDDSDLSLDPGTRELVPPLLWAYLDAGAKLCGSPAYDRDFACVDFLTVIDLAHLRDDLIRKYRPW